MKKHFLTPKKIREAFGIKARRLTYLVELGYVVADVQDLRERGLVRLFSPYEAIKAGLIEYFCTNHGMTLDRAAKLANVAAMAPTMLRELHGQLCDKVPFEVVVTNGQLAYLKFYIPTGTDKIDEHMYLSSLYQQNYNDDIFQVFNSDIVQSESKCSFFVNNIIDRFASQLGLTFNDINAPTEWPFSIGAYMPMCSIIIFKQESLCKSLQS